jgi:drug/metabolite transporter (DMT)-like permease
MLYTPAQSEGGGVELWIPITFAAAFFQNLRSALQKHLKGRLSTSGATFARFLFAAPLAGLYVVGLHEVGGLAWPTFSAEFAAYFVVGGLSQIAATALLVSLFSLRNFAVGTAYSKTETVQTALFGIVILGDSVGIWAAVAILVSLAGVVALSTAKSGAGPLALVKQLTGRPALIGMASGAGFGISAVAYRAAALSLGGDGFWMQAGYTLACVLVFQTVVMAAYLRLREPGQISALLGQWRIAIWVGVSGMLASVGWFTAMTIQNAAYVRALGQVELVFTFIASVVFFRERMTAIEFAGILLIVGGLILLLLA